jgi:hypothetical protein
VLSCGFASTGLSGLSPDLLRACIGQNLGLAGAAPLGAGASPGGGVGGARAEVLASRRVLCWEGAWLSSQVFGAEPAQRCGSVRATSGGLGWLRGRHALLSTGRAGGQGRELEGAGRCVLGCRSRPARTAARGSP